MRSWGRIVWTAGLLAGCQGSGELVFGLDKEPCIAASPAGLHWEDAVFDVEAARMPELSNPCTEDAVEVEASLPPEAEDEGFSPLGQAVFVPTRGSAQAAFTWSPPDYKVHNQTLSLYMAETDQEWLLGMVGSPSFDQDGDGWEAAEAGHRDCDDSDPGVHPEALETCDGVDQDCDGEVDEEAVDARVLYVDADGDGYGLDGSLFETCDPYATGATAGGECNDDDPGIHPGAEEVCNFEDDDCDGLIDPGCTECPELDDGLTADGDDITCEGEGYIGKVDNSCMHDGGCSGGGDDLEIYCFNRIARFCLSGEDCKWRDGLPEEDDCTICDTSGLCHEGHWMAQAYCEEWRGHSLYWCSADGEMSFD